MIVEFFGFPGSGKTTISNEVIKQLELQNHSVVRGTFDHKRKLNRIILKLFYSTIYILVNPLEYWKQLYFFKKNNFKKHYNDFINITYLLCRYQFYKKTKKVVIFDQGLIQAYYSLACFHSEYENYNYNVIFRKAKTIICLDLNLNDNIKRLKGRKLSKSRIDNFKEDNFKDFTIIFRKIKNTLMQDYPYKKLLLLDAKETIQSNAKTILKKLY